MATKEILIKILELMSKQNDLTQDLVEGKSIAFQVLNYEIEKLSEYVKNTITNGF
jgi:uncharacterized protein YoxC